MNCFVTSWQLYPMNQGWVSQERQNGPYCIIYFFEKKVLKNVGYDFLKLTGVKHPGGETAEGRKVRESWT